MAEAFEDEYVNNKLMEAFRKNNIHYKGFTDDQVKIKKKVETWPPKPKVPIFELKAYPLQSYFSQLIRYAIFKILSNCSIILLDM